MNYQYKITPSLTWAHDVGACALTRTPILRTCFPFGKRRMELVAIKFGNWKVIPLYLQRLSIGKASNQKFYIMSKDINIKDCRKAVNQAKYSPTKARKANAIKLLKELMDAVNNLEEVAPKPKRKKSKTSKPKAKRKNSNQRLEEKQAKANVAENFISDEVAEVNHLPEFSELRSLGYSVEDAVRYVRTLIDGAPQVA